MATIVIEASGIVRAAAYMAMMADASLGIAPSGENEFQFHQSPDGKTACCHNIQGCQSGSEAHVIRRSREWFPFAHAPS
jgi:hypothetical protein